MEYLVEKKAFMVLFFKRTRFLVFILLIVGLIIPLSPIYYLAYATPYELVIEEKGDVKKEITSGGSTNLQVQIETFGSQSKVIITKEFSTTNIDRESIVDEITKKFPLSRDVANGALKLLTDQEKKDMTEKLLVNITVKECVSDVKIDLEFVLDTNDRDKILDAIVQRTQLTNNQIEDVLEFNIDKINIGVNVAKGIAKVQIEFCDKKTRFVLNTADENTIIAAIKEKTGLREYKIPRIWKFSTDVVEKEKRPLTLEEQRIETLKSGEHFFNSTKKQLSKAEKGTEAVTTGEGLPKAVTGGGCLIATATFGSEMAPQVQALREVRDSRLLQTQSGKTFMNAFNGFYYSFSPTIADWERENPTFKEVVKITITPLLTSLSILNYIDMDSEEKVLSYGIGIILLNIGMYFVAPALIIIRLRQSKVHL